MNGNVVNHHKLLTNYKYTRTYGHNFYLPTYFFFCLLWKIIIILVFYRFQLQNFEVLKYNLRKRITN